MPGILVLCPGREGRRIVENQLRNIRAEVVYLSTHRELRVAAAASGVQAVVSDLFDGDGSPVAPFLRDLNREFPELKIVVSYDPAPAVLDDIQEMVASGARCAFAARSHHGLDLLLGPLLAERTTRSPSAAERVLARVIPHATTAAARRCLTFASVNPAHRIRTPLVAQYCNVTDRTLSRHLESIGPLKSIINGLAWTQANYMLTALRWRAAQVAKYFGLMRPAYLIDLLADYVESGLWQLGLDEAVDGVTAVAVNTAKRKAIWPHRQNFLPCAELERVLLAGRIAALEEMSWSPQRRDEIGHRILSLLGGGLSPMEIVRRLWTHYDVLPGHLYRGVMQLVHALRSDGLVKDR